MFPYLFEQGLCSAQNTVTQTKAVDVILRHIMSLLTQ